MAWKPDSGRSPNRPFVMGDEGVFVDFHKRMNDVARLVPFGAHPADIEYQRDEIRREVRELVERHGFGGPYLIPV